MNQVGGYIAQIWKPATANDPMEYVDYWNDAEIEQRKDIFWVLDGNFEKMERYLQKSRLGPQLDEVTAFVHHELNRPLDGVGADLAAGVLWAVPRLLAVGDIQKIYAVEYSQHRLFQIAPELLKHYHVPEEKVVLCLGSFYDIHLPAASLDFLFLSQAFHHADDPDALLAEMRRVLKSGGLVLMIGEHIVKPSLLWRLKHLVKYIISRCFPPTWIERLWGRRFDVPYLSLRRPPLPPDPLLGDHFYYQDEYEAMFRRHGFDAYNLRDQAASFQSFVLIKRP